MAEELAKNNAGKRTVGSSSRLMKPLSICLPGVRNFGRADYVSTIRAFFLVSGVVMIANVLMLVLCYFLLVVPILWCLRPAKLVTPF